MGLLARWKTYRELGAIAASVQNENERLRNTIQTLQAESDRLRAALRQVANQATWAAAAHERGAT
jgi:hypothetical protein